MPLCNKCNKDKVDEDFKKKADGSFLKRCKACNQIAADVNKKLKEKKLTEQSEAKPEEPVEIKKKDDTDENNIDKGLKPEFADNNDDESSDSDDELAELDENDLACGLAITYEYVLSRLISDGYLIKK